jgi:hypothetical protein
MFVASLSLLPCLQSLRLDCAFARGSRSDLEQQTPFSMLSTISLVTGFVYRIHDIPEQFKQVELQTVQVLEIEIFTNDPRL